MDTARRRARTSGALTLLIACACAQIALAAGTNGAASDDAAHLLTQARSEIEQLRYDSAVASVLPLLSHSSKRVRLEALEITAEAHLILGRLSEGRAALAALYTIAPGFVLRDPTLPPRVTSEFDAAAAESYGRTVAIVVRPVDSDAAEFEIAAGGDTTHLEIACRSGDADSFVPMATVRVATSYRFRLPTSGTYSCHAVALDADALPLGRLGSERAPFDLRPHALKERPITTTWWFWSAVGALVVGSAAVTYAVTRTGPPPPPADATVSLVHPSAVSW
jgi:hypothetical protein